MNKADIRTKTFSPKLTEKAKKRLKSLKKAAKHAKGTSMDLTGFTNL